LRFVVGISGASGIIYGLRLLEVLNALGHEVHTIVTEAALKVAEAECCTPGKVLEFVRARSKNVYSEDDLLSPLSSSSYLVDGVAVAPCSLKTLSDVASSRPSNLLTRSVINALRTRRRVVLLIRETPLGTLDLLNAFKASVAGATIMPASPGFYTSPSTIADLVDFVVGKVLDALDVGHSIYRRWEGLRGPTQGRSLCAQLFGLECP